MGFDFNMKSLNIDSAKWFEIETSCCFARPLFNSFNWISWTVFFCTLKWNGVDVESISIATKWMLPTAQSDEWQIQSLVSLKCRLSCLMRCGRMKSIFHTGQKTPSFVHYVCKKSNCVWCAVQKVSQVSFIHALRFSPSFGMGFSFSFFTAKKKKNRKKKQIIHKQTK